METVALPPISDMDLPRHQNCVERPGGDPDYKFPGAEALINELRDKSIPEYVNRVLSIAHQRLSRYGMTVMACPFSVSMADAVCKQLREKKVYAKQIRVHLTTCTLVLALVEKDLEGGFDP